MSRYFVFYVSTQHCPPVNDGQGRSAKVEVNTCVSDCNPHETADVFIICCITRVDNLLVKYHRRQYSSVAVKSPPNRMFVQQLLNTFAINVPADNMGSKVMTNFKKRTHRGIED